MVTGADDDSVDVDVGYKGTIQYVIAAQKALRCRGLDDRDRLDQCDRRPDRRVRHP